MEEEVNNKLDISLPIRGMTCAACVMHVEHALKDTPGVLAVTVNLATEKAAVSLESGPVPLDALRHSIADAGYDIETSDANLNVGGMTCAACVMHVEHALRGVPGVVDAAVNLATERARVSYVPGLAGIPEFRDALEDSGYRLDGVEGDERDSAAELERLARTGEIRYFRNRTAFAVTVGIVLLLGSMHLLPWVPYLNGLHLGTRWRSGRGSCGPWRRRCSSGRGGPSTLPAYRPSAMARPICTPWWLWGRRSPMATARSSRLSARWPRSGSRPGALVPPSTSIRRP